MLLSATKTDLLCVPPKMNITYSHVPQFILQHIFFYCINNCVRYQLVQSAMSIFPFLRLFSLGRTHRPRCLKKFIGLGGNCNRQSQPSTFLLARNYSSKQSIHCSNLKACPCLVNYASGYTHYLPTDRCTHVLLWLVQTYSPC